MAILHAHSTHSILDGHGTPEMMVKRAKAVGQMALAITDHGNTSAHVQLEKAAKAEGVKPIYGCEFYMVKDVASNKQRKNHITVLAKNLTGYRNLLHLSSLSFTQGFFYYRPTIDLGALEAHQDGLIILSGCLNGLATEAILNENYQDAYAWLNWMHVTFNDFYVEIQPLELEESKVANVELITMASQLGIPLVATTDAHFTVPEDRNVQSFMGMVRRKLTVQDNWGLMDARCTIASNDEMVTWGAPLESVVNTDVIAALVEPFDLPRAQPVKFGVDNPYEDLVQLCRDGWRSRGINRKPKDKQDEYVKRVKYELDMIKRKDFVDYFLVTADMVRWAKENDILVGPARGSAAGSLVSYLTGITEVDPIEWDLLFERFIDISRLDPPDIDLDFQHDRRDEVKDYLRSKYGADRVTNIAGYSVFKGKSLLDDMGRVYRIPKSHIEEAKADLIEDGGSKTVQEIIEERWPDLSHVAKAEGMIRQLTVHAAGVVVCSDKLEKFTTVGQEGIMLDYRDATELGLLKIDVLSLKTLTILKRVLDNIGKGVQWLYNLPLDDSKTYEGFGSDRFQGVFQYEGHTTKGICQRLKPNDFQTLIDINALSRPGPLKNGATEAYIHEQIDDIHPVVSKYTARSRGQILYQEQIMKILREAGNLDWSDVTAVRKLITKKQGMEKLAGIKERFLKAFPDREELGEEIWKRCGESGAYGFNISHSTSYTFIGYYCMYLKMHYPLEFYWANMDVEPEKLTLLREYVQSGGKVFDVRYPRSRAGWSIDKGGLRAGYLTLRGIGPVWGDKLEKGIPPAEGIRKVLEAAGAFDEETELEADYFGLESLRERLARIPMRDKIVNIKPGDFVQIAGVISKLEIKSLREYYKMQGKNYEEEVRDPEKDTYAYLMLADESGEIMVAINRYMYCDPVMKLQLQEYKPLDIFIAKGERVTDYQKVRAIRFANWSAEHEKTP